jgi:hypothetical protein
MNTLNLKAYGVSEMSKKEMLEVDGGGRVKDALIAAANAIVDAATWVNDRICIRIGRWQIGGAC